MLTNIFNRHSVRDFTERPIAKSKLERMVQAGVYAPTGHNLQTWKFTVIQDKEKIDELRSAIERAAKEMELKLYGFNNPTALILISNDRRNENCIQDSSCAAENIMLAATSYGIGTVWLNHLKKISDCPEIRVLLNSYNIPENHIVWATIGMGYPAGFTQILYPTIFLRHLLQFTLPVFGTFSQIYFAHFFFSKPHTPCK